MFFASDNAGPVHPKVLEALARANDGYVSGYGSDDVTTRARDAVREVFEAPDAMVHFVATGTAANALALACLAEPWQTVFCSPVAHIHVDECNAPEFYTGGAKLTLVGDGDKITPEALRRSVGSAATRGVHEPQRGPLSITQATEMGAVYSIAEITALSQVAKDFVLPVHMDGARFANALVSLGCTPAEMTWKAGVDAVSFGGTKNGCMGVEAVVFFDPAKSWEFELRRKRGGHLFSKHRYLAAQMEAYLADGLWLDLARAANGRMARLTQGLRAAGIDQPEVGANMAFPSFSRALHRKLKQAGAQYYLWKGEAEGADDDEELVVRLVTDWSLPEAEIDRFLSLLR